MSSPLEQTTDVDVDAVPEVTVEQSQAPAGSAGSPLPAVGTNARSEWAMWDPNLWWTDWSLPPDPRPSWEQWFDWVNQLQALTPALGEASQDWQTMIGQFEDSLRAVRAMRTDLADWTGPSAQTMSDALDRLEESITTKSAAIQNNPARLDQLAQSISDAVPPMAALDAEYQQVLQDLNACRQVAERGKPIMLNLATELLQVGTDLENSVMTDNLAPQPVPPQPLALTEGPQGPTQQLTQVAGSSNLTDPGAVVPADMVPVADQPAPAGAGNLADPGQVQSGQQVAAGSVPGVSVGPADQTAASSAASAQPATAAASPTLAGASAGTAAPAMSAAPVAATPAPTVAGSGPVMPMAQFGAPAAVSGAGPASATPMATPMASPVVGPPVAPDRERKRDNEKAAAVHPGLRGRTGQPKRHDGTETHTPRRQAEAPDGGAFEVEDAGTGTVTAPR